MCRELARSAVAALLVLITLTLPAAAHAQSSPGEGPGGPILVVANDADPFGRYYAEILRAEGLNEFSVASPAALEPQTLSGYHVVLLASMGLSDAQASSLSQWVLGGGNLVAMRPDPRLAGVLGLGADTGDLAEGYLQVDAGSAPGAGITGATVQFHGTADRWTLAGATPVATMFGDATTATANPAVTLNGVGVAGGQAAAFTYDLARSVVYTRQGNPGWAGLERDGINPRRSDDLFFGASQADWVNLDKVAIPQADEQQRLLANLITLMSLDRAPLPRFWYLPRGEKATVVMTGDDHDQGTLGTQGQFGMFEAASPTGCSVADWECVRSTSYAYPSATVMSNAQAGTYRSRGFELALHLTTNCADFTPESLKENWDLQLVAFESTWPSAPAPRTNRTHCIAWSDWVGEPKAELAHGVRLDTNYYYWPRSWVQGRPGVFTGSGFPMRFADTDGSLIDVYQATTQLTDELGSSPTDWAHVPGHIRALLDRALGPEGYYGVFTTNMHTDYANHDGANAIVAEAAQRNVPVVSAEQMLDWLDGRNGSSFQGVRFAAGRLEFTVARASGARGLEAMVPASAGSGALLTLTRDGADVGTTLRTVKGIQYAVFDAAAGAYVASYAPGAGSPTRSGSPSGAKDRSAPRVRLARRTLRASKRGIVVLPVRCPRTERRCRIDLRLRRAGKSLARSRFVVAGGKTARVHLTLPRRALARLVRRGSMRLTVVMKARDAAGNRRTTKTRVRLLAPRGISAAQAWNAARRSASSRSARSSAGSSGANGESSIPPVA
jgi:hypothetical protein